MKIHAVVLEIFGCLCIFIVDKETVICIEIHGPYNLIKCTTSGPWSRLWKIIAELVLSIQFQVPHLNIFPTLNLLNFNSFVNVH